MTLDSLLCLIREEENAVKSAKFAFRNAKSFVQQEEAFVIYDEASDRLLDLVDRLLDKDYEEDEEISVAFFDYSDDDELVLYDEYHEPCFIVPA